MILFILWMMSWDDGELAKVLAKSTWIFLQAIDGLNQSVCGKWR